MDSVTLFFSIQTYQNLIFNFLGNGQFMDDKTQSIRNSHRAMLFDSKGWMTATKHIIERLRYFNRNVNMTYLDLRSAVRLVPTGQVNMSQI